MHKVSIKLDCPKCGFLVNASLENSCHGFLLFVCPKCQSNVVYYNNKIDIISDRMLSKLIKEKKLKMCGELGANPGIRDGQPINFDDIVNLRIALETSLDVSDFLGKI